MDGHLELASRDKYAALHNLPLPGSGALRGTQLHLQAAFRSGASIALTPDLVSPFLLD